MTVHSKVLIHPTKKRLQMFDSNIGTELAGICVVFINV